jgi:hypothetical protein
MKKLFTVLLALGLIMAFAVTASATDVKFSGSYYLVGVYDDSPSLYKDTDYSRAYMYQRLRIQPVFEIAKGLTFTARFDAMDGTFDSCYNARTAANPLIANNFDWDRGYVTFLTGIGQFDVGYMSGGAWGTLWADSEGDRARVKYTGKFGPVMLVAIFEKILEANTARIYTPVDNEDAMKTDADYTNYYLAPIYLFKGGQAGVLYGYLADNSRKPDKALSGKKQILYPYMKATFGPVYVEAEFNYLFGSQEYDRNFVGTLDRDYDGYGAYLMAKTNMGPASIGAQVGWSSGQDINKTAANGGDITVGPGKGADWNPALILFNDDLNTWSGGDANTNAGGAGNSNLNDGYLIFNLFGDYKVTPKFSMGAALTYAKADEVQIAGQDDEYGTEFDVTVTYKIYDNLSYMVGAGMLWTGDWYKGGVAAAQTEDDYILMNKLTLTF